MQETCPRVPNSGQKRFYLGGANLIRQNWSLKHAFGTAGCSGPVAGHQTTTVTIVINPRSVNKRSLGVGGGSYALYENIVGFPMNPAQLGRAFPKWEKKFWRGVLF
jgi:hypothetical protein